MQSPVTFLDFFVIVCLFVLMAGVHSAHLWGMLDVSGVHATQSCSQPAPSPVHSWVIWGEIYGAPQRH